MNTGVVRDIKATASAASFVAPRLQIYLGMLGTIPLLTFSINKKTSSIPAASHPVKILTTRSSPHPHCCTRTIPLLLPNYPLYSAICLRPPLLPRRSRPPAALPFQNLSERHSHLRRRNLAGVAMIARLVFTRKCGLNSRWEADLIYK